MGMPRLFFNQILNVVRLRLTRHQQSGRRVMNPLTSVKGSIATGAIIAVVLALVLTGGWNELSLARWFHILSGITWIGLLYYFNVVQVPALGEAAADKGGPGGAGISKYVAPRA